jgi:hypothetical protein
MRNATMFAVIVLGVISASAFVYMFPPVPAAPGASQSSGSSRNVGSQGAVGQTYLATYVSTLATAPPETTSSAGYSTSSTSFASQTSGGGQFTYTPSPQVKVLSVSALVSGTPSGGQALSFRVSYENIGSGDIYVVGGGGSSLNATFTSGTSLLQRISTPRCEIPEAILSVNPGSDAVSVTPGCWSGYYYEVTSTGTVGVKLTLTWSNGTGSGAGAGSIEIYAEFTLG